MIRVILILLVLIVFLLVSALPLLIGEKCVWKNDENRQKEYALQVVKRVLRMVFRLTGSINNSVGKFFAFAVEVG